MALGKAFPGVRSGMSKQGLIDIDIKPLPIILVGKFESLAISVRSFREPLKRSIQKVIIPSINKNFEAEGRPKFWEPLAPDTIYQRGYKGFAPGPILQRSGRMRRAATALARWTITKDEAYAGGDWPGSAFYGPLQHSGFGVSGKFVKGSEQTFGAEIPARPFMLIQEEDQPKIELQFRLWFAERVAKAGI